MINNITNQPTNKKRTARIKANKHNNNDNKKTKPSTVAPELMTLDCSLTRVLQVPDTQPNHR